MKGAPQSDKEQDKEVRRNNAARLALSKMEKARESMELEQQENFYVETAFAIHGYLQEKYDIATEDLRKDFVAAFLSTLDNQTDYASMYLNIMAKTDLALYGASQPADISATYQNSISFISDLELLSSEKVT
ncbi:MAG: hypothetical protein IPN29_14205 [Saprospiraceae bacterium]|nr:hypothetical protein [Saprospiraceae bacterium]